MGLTVTVLVIAAAVLAAAYDVVAGRVTNEAHGFRIEGWLISSKAARAAAKFGCHEGALCQGARPRRPHRHCTDCGDWTCGLQVRIAASLKRTRVPCCGRCDRRSRFAPPGSAQSVLADQRRKLDWTQMSTPVVADRLQTGVMGEQYPSAAREALRAFAASEAQVATIDSVSATVLQQSIHSLGLADEVYAEQRGNQAVLRRIAARGASSRRGVR